MKLLSQFPDTEYNEIAAWHVWRKVDNERLCKVVEEAAASTSNVEVVEMTPVEINSRYNSLNLEEVFKTAPAIEGIMHCHYLKVVHGKTVGNAITKNMEDENTTASVGDWCQVTYDKLYPGEIKAKAEGEYLVSVMVPAGSYWKWPSKKDEILYPEECIIKRLDPPTVVNARGHFQFHNLE
ncbi:hypothetical protein JTE90_021155 [Oedothorax gibbosus]|nr:hypothetical protein JTE90_021155 [Oedothorax gibbosus]